MDTGTIHLFFSIFKTKGRFDNYHVLKKQITSQIQIITEYFKNESGQVFSTLICKLVLQSG